MQNTNDGLVYSLTTNAAQIENEAQPLKYNTLKVPIGGIYQVKLPDGTKVWLNSATSMNSDIFIFCSLRYVLKSFSFLKADLKSFSLSMGSSNISRAI